MPSWSNDAGNGAAGDVEALGEIFLRVAVAVGVELFDFFLRRSTNAPSWPSATVIRLRFLVCVVQGPFEIAGPVVGDDAVDVDYLVVAAHAADEVLCDFQMREEGPLPVGVGADDYLQETSGAR